LGFFWSLLTPKLGFINGPSLYMWADGRKEEPTRLKIDAPDGWDVATAMTKTDDGVYTAGDYDELLDSPIQMGAMQRRQFEVNGLPFEVVWVVGNNEGFQPDLDAETDRIRRGSAPAIALFGGAPFKRYTYIIHLGVGDFAGGLEHRSSTVIAMPNIPILHLDDLATHEYFHAWNVKSIRPVALGPFDYTAPVRVKDLWFSEGVTDYYAKLTAYQAGQKNRQWVFESFGNALEEIDQSGAGKRMTVEDASSQAWENGGFGVQDFSYYTKGLLAGLVFDVRLRARSNGKVSLDDAMRTLYKSGALPKPGFADGEIRRVLIELGGADMAALYDATIRGKGQVPVPLVADDFRALGMRVLMPGQTFAMPRFQVDPDGLVTAVADKADTVHVGDKILGMKQTAPTTAEVRLSRGGAEQTLSVPVTVTRVADYRIEEDPFATDAARALREQWLHRLPGVRDEEG
ncbi:M61 family peptidase, partial [bacterium]